jgi:hypothetical protein
MVGEIEDVIRTTVNGNIKIGDIEISEQLKSLLIKSSGEDDDSNNIMRYRDPIQVIFEEDHKGAQNIQSDLSSDRHRDKGEIVERREQEEYLMSTQADIHHHNFEITNFVTMD